MTTAPLRWAIIGPGGIARKFARDLRIAGGHLRAVAGRDAARAGSFASEFSAGLVFDDLNALADEKSVDAVYIATPHQAHYPAARLMLESGKAVLCEKPMTVSAEEARDLVRTAGNHRAFLMEAMWTRFLPACRQVARWLEEGRIGTVRAVTSSFCVRGNADRSRRWFNPDLAGGALLDLGVYNLAMTQLAIKALPQSVQATAHFADSGVDDFLAATLTYPGQQTAQFACGLSCVGVNSLVVAGEEGSIEIPPVFIHAKEATLRIGDKVETHRAPFRGEGFEYEIEEATRCIAEGLLESPLMTHADTVSNMEIMDQMRLQIGLRYPWEPGGAATPASAFRTSRSQDSGPAKGLSHPMS